MKILLILVALVGLALGGCSGQIGATPPSPILTTGVTLGADVGATALLQNTKASDRPAVAAVLNQLGQGIYAAAGSPPSYTALDALIVGKLATWNSPYAPLVLAIARQALADAQAQAGSLAAQNPQAATPATVPVTQP